MTDNKTELSEKIKIADSVDFSESFDLESEIAKHQLQEQKAPPQSENEVQFKSAKSPVQEELNQKLYKADEEAAVAEDSDVDQPSNWKKKLLIGAAIVTILTGALVHRFMKNPDPSLVTQTTTATQTATAGPAAAPVAPAGGNPLPPLPGGTEIYASDDALAILDGDKTELDVTRKTDYLTATQRSCANNIDLTEYDQAVCKSVGEARYFECAPDGKRFNTSCSTPGLPKAITLGGTSDVIFLDALSSDAIMGKEDSLIASTANSILENRKLTLTGQTRDQDDSMSGITAHSLESIAPAWWSKGPVPQNVSRETKIAEIRAMVQARKHDVENGKLFALQLPVSVKTLLSSQVEAGSGTYELVITDFLQQLANGPQKNLVIDDDGALNVRLSTPLTNRFFATRTTTTDYFLRFLNPSLRGGAIPAAVTITNIRKFRITDRLAVSIVFERVGIPTKQGGFDGATELVIQNAMAKHLYLTDLETGEIIDGGPKGGMNLDALTADENDSRILRLGAGGCSYIRSQNHVVNQVLEECSLDKTKVKSISRDKEVLDLLAYKQSQAKK